MAIKKILKMGHPLLRQKAIELSAEEIRSPQTQELIQDLVDTMTSAEGIGIAAPQIGVGKQIAIVGFEKQNQRYPELATTPLQIIINPKIEILDPTHQGYWEGCLSVPGLRGYVERPQKIKVSFLDENQKEHRLELEGFLATVFQHEIDHLFGYLYVDKIKDIKKLSFIDEFVQFHSTSQSGSPP